MEMFADWHDYFIAQVGAAAALSGLLFVAMSINIERILKYPWLPSRAAVAMLLLVGTLIESSFALWPHQPARIVGVELLAASGIVWIAALRLTFGGPRATSEYASETRRSDVLLQLTAITAVAGAAIVVGFGSPAGVYVIATSMLMAISIGFLNSWVLLVEILR